MKAKRMKIKEKPRKSANRKRIFLITIIILVIIAIGVFTYQKIEDHYEEEKMQESIENGEKVLPDSELGSLKMQNIKITVNDDISKLNAKIENMSDEDFTAKNIYIVLIKENNEELVRFNYQLEDIAKKNAVEVKLLSTTNLNEAVKVNLEEIN